MLEVQKVDLPEEVTIVLGMWTRAAESVGARVEVYEEDGEQYLGINKPELWPKVVEAFKSFAEEEGIEFVEDPDYAEDYD